MKRIHIAAAATFIFGILIVVGCRKEKEPNTTPASFDKTAMLKSEADNVALPAFSRFVSRTEELYKALGALKISVTVPGIEHAQQQWIAAASAWKQCELWTPGPIRQQSLQTKVHTWPVNDVFVMQFIFGSELIDESYVAGKGSSSKGLAAIEYLLFPEAGVVAGQDSLTTSPFAVRRLDYMIAAAQNLKTLAAQMSGIWRQSGGNYYGSYVGATAAGITGSLDVTVNEIVAMLETMLNGKLAKPMGKTSGTTADNKLSEAWRSRSSVALLQANLVAVRCAYQGGADSSGTGIDDYLNFLGAKYDNQKLTDKIMLQFAAVEESLAKISPDLGSAMSTQMSEVETCYQELKQLLVLFKTDVASQLSVTLTLNDNDGD